MTFDQKWFERFVDISRPVDEFGIIDASLKIDIKGQRTFFQDELENPHFTYKAKSQTIFDSSKYDELVHDIQTHETNEVVLDLYVQKIAHQNIRIGMLNATINKDDKAFYEQSVLLYGKPKKKYFAYIAKQIKGMCAAAETKEQIRAAKRLKKIFSKIDTSRCAIGADILPPVTADSGPVISAQQVAEIFEAALDRYGIQGWSIVIDTIGERTHFSVAHSTKCIHVPNDARLQNRQKPFTLLQAEAVAEHEIGVHVRRSYNGSLSPLQLLSVGLHGYVKGEEGLASFVQQQTEGAVEFYGFQRYLAASLARGLDGQGVRDFRAVFSLMHDYFVLVLPPQEAVVERAKKLAWETCIRIFRGTTARTPGCIFTKDIVYLEGNIELWDMIIADPKALTKMFVGKYSPLVTEHVNALESLGILTK